MTWFQNLTVVLKFLPLLFVGVAGWFFVSKGNFGAFNASGGSLYSAIGIAAGVALFSFIGVEVAAITAKRVKNPRVNVGRASLLGTAASPILYLAVSAVIIGLVPHHALVHSTAPFVLAFGTIFTHGAWAVYDERQARVLAASQHWEIRQDGTGWRRTWKRSRTATGPRWPGRFAGLRPPSSGPDPSRPGRWGPRSMPYAASSKRRESWRPSGGSPTPGPCLPVTPGPSSRAERGGMPAGGRRCHGARPPDAQDEGTTAMGPCAWFRTACLTEPGPCSPGCSACLPMTTRSARADRPTRARPGWPCTTS